MSDHDHLQALRKTFTEIAGEDGHIDPKELARALGIKDAYVAARVMALFDVDASGDVDTAEFLEAVERLVHGSPDEKLGFAFRLHDVNEDGVIEFEELRQLIKAALRESRLDFHQAHEEQLTSILFEEADTNDDGQITLEEFRATLHNYPDILEAMTMGSVHWLHQRHQADPTVPRLAGSSLRRWRRTLQNNVSVAVLYLVWLGINVWLFQDALIRYQQAGANLYVQIARGCGAALNFNGALILLPMMRTWLTLLRRSVLGHYLPIDHSVDFHKLVGQAMFAYSLVHTAAHLLNYSTLPAPVWQSLLLTWAGATGLGILLIFVVMWVTALEPVRRGGHFEVFYIAHFGYVGFMVLALLHGPVFWMWAGVPLLGFVAERLYRWANEKQATFISNVQLLASKVTHLEIERPSDFHFEPGAYVFVRIPEISRWEWHPFTISSAPEQQERLSLHIRTAGNWTKALHAHYTARLNDGLASDDPRVRLDIELDGPYGTPSEHVFDSKVGVLVGAGIGVTPFASILQSILDRKRAGEKMKLEKVYFYWLNREQKAFEWFTGLLADLERLDHEQLIDIQIWMTGMKPRTDMKAATLHIAMDLAHKQTRIDLITGLRSKTHGGRPDWGEELRRIAGAHEGEAVDVFLCGPPGLGRELGGHCRALGFNFRKENF